MVSTWVARNVRENAADILTDYPASSNQHVLPSDSKQSTIRQRKAIEQLESVADHDSDIPGNVPRALSQKLRFLSTFFRASVLAARIPFVSAASTGEDFSNNLFSDLAPILALFGEQVTWPHSSARPALT